MDNTGTRILNTGVFNRLTSLRCYLGNTPNDLLFTALPNGPNLTTLVIKVDTIVFHSLETLSNLIPNVNSFTLEIQLQHGVRQLTVEPIRDGFVIAIKQHVRTFKIITSTQHFGRFGLLLTYLQVKYPNLTQLVYSEVGGTPSNQVTQFHGHLWQTLLEARNTTMETLVLGRLRKSNHLVHAATQQVFPELKHLELVLYNDQRLYQSVMNHGWRNRITSLALSQVPTGQGFDHLNLFTSLQKVHLGYQVPRAGMTSANIEDIMNSLPATTVSLSLENLLITNNFAPLNQNSNISDLKFKSCGFMGDIMSQFLTTHLPQLTSFALYYCIPVGNVHLPNHDLDKFECTVVAPLLMLGLYGNDLVRLTMEQLLQHFQINIQDASYFFKYPLTEDFITNLLGADGDRPLQRTLRPHVGGGAMPPIIFNITCRSIREAYYCGYLLLLFN